MLPFVFQVFQINLAVALVFYAVFILTAQKLNVQGLSLIQLCHSFIRLAILAVLSIWIYGLYGGWAMVLFVLPASLVSFGYSFFKTRKSVPLNGFLLMIPFAIFGFLLVVTIEAGSTLSDWMTFHRDCPTVSVRELADRSERAFVVTNADIKRALVGHHTWESTDSDGNTTTYHAYYAPLVDQAWTPAEPIVAWVDLDDPDVEWVGRLIKDPPSDEEWTAVRNAKSKHSLIGVGRQNGEETYRVVESDVAIIQTVNENRVYHLIALVFILVLSAVSLFWVRDDGALSKRSNPNA